MGEREKERMSFFQSAEEFIHSRFSSLFRVLFCCWKSSENVIEHFRSILDDPVHILFSISATFALGTFSFCERERVVFGGSLVLSLAGKFVRVWKLGRKGTVIDNRIRPSRH
jgi:hypothetical protein